MNTAKITSVLNGNENEPQALIFTNSPQNVNFTLPQVMRWTGSIMLICAGAFFMIQGFDSISFLTRHWIFTAIVFAMGGFGLFTGLILKEIKGARVLLGLSVALIPVLFSQLGALIQSLTADPQVTLPKVILAQCESPVLTLITALSTIGLVIPVILFGFKVLARPQCTLLSITYFLLNAVILIPGRNPSFSGALFLLMALLISYLYTLRLQNSSIYTTIEGKLSMLMMFSPLAIVASRALFYNPDLLYFGFLFGGAGILLLNIQSKVPQNLQIKSFQKTGGILFLMSAVPLISLPVFQNMAIPSEIIPFTILLPELLLIAYVTHSNNDKKGETVRMLAAIVTLAIVIVDHLICTNSTVSIMTMVTGIVLIALSVSKKERGAFYVGILCTAGGITGALWSTLKFQSQWTWVLFAIIGIVALLFGTLSEMYKARFQTELAKWNWTWKGKDKCVVRTVV
jgi:hypothetical protein